MTFEKPLYLLLLLGLPLIPLIVKLGAFRPFRVKMTLSNWGETKTVWSLPFYKFLRNLYCFFGFCSAFLIVIALANPVIYHTEKMYTTRGAQILFMVDVSPSMGALDMKDGANRLQTAVSLIKDFAGKRTGDLLGLGVIGSSAALVIPPTDNIDVFTERINSLYLGEMGSGSALGDGLSLGASHLVPVSGENKSPPILILITDGESNSGKIHPETGAKLVKDLGIIFYVIGVGSKGEVAVDYTDKETGKRITGILNSTFDEFVLQNLAMTGGGSYYYAETETVLSDILQKIDSENPVSGDFYLKNESKSLATPVVLFAVICFILYWFIKRIVLGNVL